MEREFINLKGLVYSFKARASKENKVLIDGGMKLTGSLTQLFVSIMRLQCYFLMGGVALRGDFIKKIFDTVFLKVYIGVIPICMGLFSRGDKPYVTYSPGIH